MSEDNSAIRLKGFIEFLGLSYSVFADECGVPRPSLSQILSGRNKKISDVLIRQIHQAYPQLSISWLLFGEGEMLTTHSSNSEFEKSDSASSDFRLSHSDENDPFRSDLGVWVSDADNSAGADEKFGENILKIADGDSAKNKYSNLKALTEAENALKDTKIQLDKANETIASLTDKIEKLLKNPRKVSQITIYYDDSTFETFIPK